MASLAGATLSWPGTSLDGMWTLNPTAHKQLATLGRPAGFLFLLLGAALALAGTGWVKRRLLGWRLAVAVIATQVLGDLVNLDCTVAQRYTRLATSDEKFLGNGFTHLRLLRETPF